MSKAGTRHELKYVVDLHEGEEFMRASEEFCRPDEHSGADGFYETLSVYYDTADLRFFWDRQESVGFRRKIRLRRYAGGAAQESPLFLEIKEKHKHLIGKKRCVISSHLVEQRVSADPSLLALDSLLAMVPPSSGRDEIGYLHDRLRLMPVVNVRYLRKALASRVDPTLRITLDKRLTGSLPSLCDYDPSTEDFFLPPSKAVLEIKSERSVPLWVLSLIRRFEFVRGRYSKYCAAVELLQRCGRERSALVKVVDDLFTESDRMARLPERVA